jgi:hypothetical protein
LQTKIFYRLIKSGGNNYGQDYWYRLRYNE